MGSCTYSFEFFILITWAIAEIVDCFQLLISVELTQRVNLFCILFFWQHSCTGVCECGNFFLPHYTGHYLKVRIMVKWNASCIPSHKTYCCSFFFVFFLPVLLEIRIFHHFFFSKLLSLSEGIFSCCSFVQVEHNCHVVKKKEWHLILHNWL